MRRKLANETVAEHVFDVPQFFQVLEGTLMIRMKCQTVAMSTGLRVMRLTILPSHFVLRL